MAHSFRSVVSGVVICGSCSRRNDICPNLYILPAGPVPPNPNELLMSNNMEHIIELLRQKFDYVIIDTAPIGIISDSFLG